MEVVEQRLQKAVEEEVHSIYDNADHHELVIPHAKAAIQKGAAKAKQAAKEQKKASGGKLVGQDQGSGEEDHRILHAVEAAEKAVLHAVQEEVDQLFHDVQPHEDHAKKGHPKDVVKSGVQKATQHVEKTQEERQQWIKERDAKAIDEYIKAANSMYGMGL